MRKFIIAAASAIALSFAAVPAFAQHAGAAHGGGGWHGGGGGWHGGHSHVVVGVGFGYPYYWGWGYPYYGYYPYAYGYPYPYAYPPYGAYGSYDDGSSSTYIQRDSGEGVAPPSSYQSPREQQYSYYCTNPAGYFPQINNCPSGWLTVVPNSAPHGAPAPR
jgi:hypothetical protein